ncbi:MAG TPA: endolytic transglycosylase MltG [Longimicrobiales bacterium]|nr:endolytic transglycosylase MltG [Longimicrobiales bacterium]
MSPRPHSRTWLAFLLALALTACGGAGEGDPVQVTVPPGAAFAHVADSLASRGVVSNAFFFNIYARIKGAARSARPGTYAFRPGLKWDRILDDLREGRVVTLRLVIPEGFDIARIAPRLAEVSGVAEDSVVELLLDSAAPARYGVPGPTLEGYLYPATYSFGVRAPLDTVLDHVVGAYRRIWTPARQARADSIDMSEREVITLAAIVEKEAKQAEEMPVIAAVYHNRLRIGIPLQADPTVQYALGTHRSRLLYAHIDSAADNPYNTYRHRGLPPGPIGSPSTRAIDATLYPADVKYLYFVARPDGSHVFTSSLADHNRAKAAIRRERERSGAP